jgi:hypothetical protein
MFALSLQGFLSRHSHAFPGRESSPIPFFSPHLVSLRRPSNPRRPVSSPSTITPTFSVGIISSTAGDLPLSPVNPLDAMFTESRGGHPAFLSRYLNASLLRHAAHTRTPRNSSPVIRLLHTSLYTGELALLPQEIRPKPAPRVRRLPASTHPSKRPSQPLHAPLPSTFNLRLSTSSSTIPALLSGAHFTQGDR